MCPDHGYEDLSGLPPESRWAFFRGVLYGFQVGRDIGFREGVRAMHKAISETLRDDEDGDSLV